MCNKIDMNYAINESPFNHSLSISKKLNQEAFLGPWSGFSIGIINGKSGLQSPGRPGSQKCLLGMDTCMN